MKYLTVSLTSEQIEKLQDLSDFYGETDQGILIKLALVKFHRHIFAKDRTEEGEDQDLEKIRGE